MVRQAAGHHCDWSIMHEWLAARPYHNYIDRPVLRSRFAVTGFIAVEQYRDGRRIAVEV